MATTTPRSPSSSGSFFAMASGFGLSWLYYIGAPWLPEATARTFKPVYLFLLNKWYFDELYDWLFVKPTMALGRFLWKSGDETVIDGTIDGNGLAFQKILISVLFVVNLSQLSSSYYWWRHNFVTTTPLP